MEDSSTCRSRAVLLVSAPEGNFQKKVEKCQNRTILPFTGIFSRQPALAWEASMAANVATALTAEIPLPLWVEGVKRKLLREMLQGYESYQLSRGVKEKTILEARRIIFDFLNHAKGIPGELEPDDFEHWAAALFSVRGIKVPSQRKYQSAVRGLFSYLVSSTKHRNAVRLTLGCDIVQVATVDNCIVHKRVRELGLTTYKRAFTQAEEDAFFQAIEDNIQIAFQQNNKALYACQRDLALFTVMRGYGLREEETTRLNVDSFEPHVAHPEFGDFGMVHVYGKNDKWRTVYTTHPQVPSVLRWYLDTVRPRYEQNAEANEQALFLSEPGNRLSYSSLRKRFLLARDTAMLSPVLTPHCLRHTSVSSDIIEGQTLETTRVKHGHEFAGTTQVYTHIPDDYTAQENERILAHRTKVIRDSKA